MADDDYPNGKPVIITAALTGGIHKKETAPALPETHAETATTARAAEKAGSSIVLLHVRKVNGERVFSAQRFKEFNTTVGRQQTTCSSSTQPAGPL